MHTLISKEKIFHFNETIISHSCIINNYFNSRNVCIIENIPRNFHEKKIIYQMNKS